MPSPFFYSANHTVSAELQRRIQAIEMEVLPQDTTHLIQRPCYQRGSLCQDPAGNRTTRRPDHCKEMQTAVVWSCTPFIRSGQNHLQGTVNGGRRQHRQRKRWEDNIKEWTGLEFGKSKRAVENMEKWRKLFAKSSVVPKRPSRLRDRRNERDHVAVVGTIVVPYHCGGHHSNTISLWRAPK